MAGSRLKLCDVEDFSEKSRFVLIAHGGLVREEPNFSLPKGYIFITLSQVDETVCISFSNIMGLIDRFRTVEDNTTFQAFLTWLGGVQPGGYTFTPRCHKKPKGKKNYFMNNIHLEFSRHERPGIFYAGGGNPDNREAAEQLTRKVDGHTITLANLVRSGDLPKGIYLIFACRSGIPNMAPPTMQKQVSAEHNKGKSGGKVIRQFKRLEEQQRKQEDQIRILMEMMRGMGFGMGRVGGMGFGMGRAAGPAGPAGPGAAGPGPGAAGPAGPGPAAGPDADAAAAENESGNGGGMGGGRKKRKRKFKHKTTRKHKSKTRMTKQKRKVNGVTRNVRISSTGRKYVLLKGKKHFL